MKVDFFTTQCMIVIKMALEKVMFLLDALGCVCLPRLLVNDAHSW
jgi:hypothetical protein